MKVAIRRKRRLYRDVVASNRCKLVVAAMEVGGRWHAEVYDLLRQLARAKARTCTPWQARGVEMATLRRWSGILAAAAQRSYLATLLGLPDDAAETELMTVAELLDNVP